MTVPSAERYARTATPSWKLLRVTDSRESVTRRSFQEGVAVRAYRSALGTVIHYRYVFTVAGLTLLIPAAVLLSRFPKDFLPDIDEGAILYMPTTLPGLPNREAG